MEHFAGNLQDERELLSQLANDKGLDDEGSTIEVRLNLESFRSYDASMLILIVKV
jgi:hypothetical protein